MTATHAHRTGKYAEAYRLGSSVRLGEIEPAADLKALGQGYRDGLKGAPYRIPKKGKGAKSRNNLHAKNYRLRKKLQSRADDLTDCSLLASFQGGAK